MALAVPIMSDGIRQSEGGINERRFKYFRIDPNHVLHLLGNWHHADNVKLPVIKGLPEGYRVVGMQSISDCWNRDSFAIRVYHPSFDPVEPTGAIPEYKVAEFEWVNLVGVKRDEERPKAFWDK